MAVALSSCPLHPSAFPAAVTCATFHSVPTSGMSEANPTSRLWVSSVTIFKEAFGFEVLTAVTPCRSNRAEHFRGRVNILDLGFCLLLLCSFLAYSLTLKMEAICSSETSVPIRTTWSYNSESRAYSSKNAYVGIELFHRRKLCRRAKR
jgi:hypothetical protein